VEAFATSRFVSSPPQPGPPAGCLEDISWEYMACDNMQNKTKFLVTRCSMCEGDLDSLDHLPVHYLFARALLKARR